jgi:hypothetical protein
MPDWISSASSSAPVESHSSRAAAKNSCAHRGNPALALDRLDADAADLVGKLRAQVGHIVEAHKLHAGITGANGSRYFSLCVVATEPIVRPWKLCSSARNRVPIALAFARNTPACARASFSAASHASVPELQKKHAVQPADLRQPQRQLRRVLVIEQVRRVQQLWLCAAIALVHRGMRVAQRIHANAAQQVEVLVALLVAQMYTPLPPVNRTGLRS